MTSTEILNRFENATEEKPGQYLCRCPSHDDQKNSLAVCVATDGKILVNCLAGCKTEDVLTAVGLEMKDLFPSKQNSKAPRGRIVAYYDYRDETKLLLYQAVRFDPKGFAQRTPKPDGSFEWKLNGARRVPFRLPELMEADSADIVFIPEGEKDVLALAGLVLVATCNVGGAGKWHDDYNEFLKGRNVVILPDNDAPGRKHAQQVAESLHGNAASVKILELDGLPEKGDVSDWIAAGGTKEKLIELAHAAPEWAPSHEATEADQDERPAGRKRKPKQRPPDDGDPLSIFHPEGQTDLANARRFIQMHGCRVRYCQPWNSWIVWDGKRWKRDDTGAVELLAKDVPDQIFRAALAFDDQETMKFGVRSASSRGITAMLALAESEPGVAVLPDQFDGDYWLLNCANGVLDLRTGEHQPHDPELLLSKLCPIDYDPKAASHEFEKCLEGIFNGNGAIIDFLRRLMGMCLCGETTEEILPIWFGTGSNGKTLLLKLFLAALGTDYSMTANRELLMEKKGERHPTELAGLFGKRLVVSIETDDGHQLAEGLVKQLTGRDRIRARGMKENFWEFEPTHKVLLATNHKPRIKGTDHAIWRRIALLPFLVKFWSEDKGESGPPELKADGKLGEKLKAELPGVLAWMVAGCLEWQRIGLKIPSDVQQATAEYRSAEDVVAGFVADKCIVMPGVKMKAGDGYKAFQRYCKDSGEKTDFTQRRFGEAMTDRGFVRTSSNGVWYTGVGFTAAAQDEANNAVQT